MSNVSAQLRLWLTLARPPLFAVALGVAVGVIFDSPVLAGAVAGVAVVAVVAWRHYWRPRSWVAEADR